MVPIKIDLTALSLEFGLTKQQSEALMEFTLKQLMGTVAANWAKQAKQNLHQSRDQYVNSITIVPKGRFEGLIVLRGVLPNMIEQGASAFDMKVGFLASAKAKQKKDGTGMYLTIPFRHANPSAVGESPIFSGILPNEVYEVAKKLGNKEQLKQGQIPAPFNQVQTRERIVLTSKVFEEYKHKTSLYAGLSKDTRPNHGGYTTFRRVSDLSDPNAFIFSGITAKNLADKAVQATNINLEVDRITKAFILGK